jgi:CDP-diacylglycerol--glycerol-3-phosphate 3-phosphatidyltransferase
MNGITIGRQSWLFKNLANIVTFFGIILSLLLIFVGCNYPEEIGWILSIVVVIGLTDFFDGILARNFQIKSKLGGGLDRARDKLFICSALIILAVYYWPLSKLPPLVVIITIVLSLTIVAMEVLLAIILLYGIKKKLPLSASQNGRIKMFLQFIAVTAWLVSLAIEKYLDLRIIGFSIYVIILILLAANYYGTKSVRDYFKRYEK